MTRGRRRSPASSRDANRTAIATRAATAKPTITTSSGTAASGSARSGRLGALRPRAPVVATLVPLLADLLVRAAEIDPREREQGQPDQHEHAEERVDLAGARQQQRQSAQADADRVDQQDRLAVRQADVEQAVVEVATVRRERRPALRDPPDDGSRTRR
jgi:hypothetical protein